MPADKLRAQGVEFVFDQPRRPAHKFQAVLCDGLGQRSVIALFPRLDHALPSGQVANDVRALQDDVHKILRAEHRIVQRVGVKRYATGHLHAYGAFGRRATQSISTSAPTANAVTPTVVRAGRRSAAKWAL